MLPCKSFLFHIIDHDRIKVIYEPSEDFLKKLFPSRSEKLITDKSTGLFSISRDGSEIIYIIEMHLVATYH